MAWTLKATLRKNCSRRVLCFSLLLSTCALIYVLLDFNITSMTLSIFKLQDGFISEERNVSGAPGLNLSVNLRFVTESVIRNVVYSASTKSNLITVSISATPTKALDSLSDNITSKTNYMLDSAVLINSKVTKTRNVSSESLSMRRTRDMSSLSCSFYGTIQSSFLNPAELSVLETSSSTAGKAYSNVTMNSTGLDDSLLSTTRSVLPSAVISISELPMQPTVLNRSPLMILDITFTPVFSGFTSMSIFSTADISTTQIIGSQSVTVAAQNSKLQSDMASKTITSQQHNSTKPQELVHYFRCASPIGRLGNMMFQLAATIGIAHTLGYKPYIAPSHDLEQYFDTRLVLDINVTNEISLSDEKCRNRTWTYDKEYWSHNLTTWGYLQSWKYFEHSTDAVRKAFSFKVKYLQEARTFLSAHTKPSNVLVGMHIRRGDFVSDYNTNLGYTIADGNYTRKAMDWHRIKSDKALFVVVSDDIPWCKDNIKGDDVIFSSFTEGIIDLAVLSLCHHCIITGGSFGWWGGWLTGGTVIYLDDFPRPGSWLWNNSETKEDYYHPNWIGMRNGIN